jgi:hypothetical protein
MPVPVHPSPSPKSYPSPSPKSYPSPVQSSPSPKSYQVPSYPIPSHLIPGESGRLLVLISLRLSGCKCECINFIYHVDALLTHGSISKSVLHFFQNTVPFRLIVQSCVTNDSEMNIPGISSGVTASSEHLLKPTISRFCGISASLGSK